jgi:tol-pal system protein YbgF
MKRMTFSLIVGLSVAVSGCAVQQDIAILENRVMALERQNRDLRGQVEEGLTSFGQSNQNAEKSLRSQYAGMNVSIESMQHDLRLLNGRIEELEHFTRDKTGETIGGVGASDPRSQERLDEISLSVARIDQRVTQIEQVLNVDRKAATSVAPVPQAQPPKAGAPVVPTPNLYDQGKQAFDDGDWENARKLFQQHIKSQPNSENADNAQFWIGESFYNEQWFEKAILEYQTVIEKYPKGNKVAGAMLKQGLAFLKLGDQGNARLILKDLQKKYPQSNEARIAADKLKGM